MGVSGSPHYHSSNVFVGKVARWAVRPSRLIFVFMTWGDGLAAYLYIYI